MCVLRHVPTQSMPYEGTTDSSTIAVDTAFLGRRRPLQRSVDNRCGYPGLNLRMTHTGTNEAGWHKTHRPCRRCRVRVTFPTAITGSVVVRIKCSIRTHTTYQAAAHSHRDILVQHTAFAAARLRRRFCLVGKHSTVSRRCCAPW